MSDTDSDDEEYRAEPAGRMAALKTDADVRAALLKLHAIAQTWAMAEENPEACMSTPASGMAPELTNLWASTLSQLRPELDGAALFVDEWTAQALAWSVGLPAQLRLLHLPAHAIVLC